MLRLATAGSISRSRRIIVGALTATVVFSAGNAVFSAYHSFFNERAHLTIGSELQLFSSQFRAATIQGGDIVAPSVVRINVSVPQRQYHSKPQEFAVTLPEDEKLSAVTKIEQPIERAVYATLSRRFEASGSKEPINAQTTVLSSADNSDVVKVTIDQQAIASGRQEHSPHLNDSSLLVAFLRDGRDEKLIAVSKVVRHGMSTQKTMTTHRHVAQVVTTKKTKKFVASNQVVLSKANAPQAGTTQSLYDIYTVDRLGYSDLVALMLNTEPSAEANLSYSDANQVVHIASPAKIDDVVKINAPQSLQLQQGQGVSAGTQTSVPLTTQNESLNQGPAAAPVVGAASSESTHVVDSQNTQSSHSKDGSVVIISGVVQPSHVTAANGTTGPKAPAPISKPVPTPTPTPVPTPTPTPQPSVPPSPSPIPRSTVQTITSFGGQLFEAFSPTHSTIVGATVQILGTDWIEHTDQSGRFSFSKINVNGVLPVVIYKDGYLKRRVDLQPQQSMNIELVSQNSAMLTASVADEKVDPANGFVFGQLVDPLGGTVETLKVEVTGPAPAHPIYLDDKGIPNKQQQFASTRGQFVLLNVVPGTYVLTITDPFGVERSPHVIHIGSREGLVRRFSIGTSTFIRGNVMNATANSAPVGDATVQLLGSAKTAKTDSNGTFTLGPIYVDCDDLNFVQVDKSGYYRNRIAYECNSTNQVNSIFIFAAGYIDSLGVEAQTPLNPLNGIIVGHVKFRQSVKMQLWGPDEVSPTSTVRGKDYYFDTDGVLNSALNRTTKSGNFAVLDAPEGLSYLQAFGKSNNTLSFRPLFISPSTVNVYIQ